ncbi:MAG TPA: hypothetical protein VGD64_09730 [Acidisarcina sp.]
MRKIPLFSVLALAGICSLFVAAPTRAQNTNTTDGKPANDDHHKDSLALFVADRYFRLDFVVREVGDDNKVVNSRAYSIVVGAVDEHPAWTGGAAIRAGSKVPVFVNGSKTVANLQDIGVNIDCRNVHLNQNNSLSLILSAEVSSIAASTEQEGPPVVRQNKWDSAVILPLNKPTVLFSSDNVGTKGKLQVELTATPVK